MFRLQGKPIEVHALSKVLKALMAALRERETLKDDDLATKAQEMMKKLLVHREARLKRADE